MIEARIQTAPIQPVLHRNQYTVFEGKRFTLGAREFKPTLPIPRENSDQGVFILGGFGQAAWQTGLTELAQNYANTARSKSFVFDTQEDRNPHSSLDQAMAAEQFIKQQKIDSATIVVYSLRIGTALRLAKQLQDANIGVNGIILLDTVGLHSQSTAELLTDFTHESIRGATGANLHYPRTLSESGREQAKKATDIGMKELQQEIVRQIDISGGNTSVNLEQIADSEIPAESPANTVRAKISRAVSITRSIPAWISRIRAELQEVQNDVQTFAPQIEAPIIIAVGKDDKVADPAKIIPDGNNGYIQDMKGREQFLKRLFKKSTVKMLVAEKRGNHSLPFSRDLAPSTLYLLKRIQREQQQREPKRLPVNPVSVAAHRDELIQFQPVLSDESEQLMDVTAVRKLAQQCLFAYDQYHETAAFSRHNIVQGQGKYTQIVGPIGITPQENGTWEVGFTSVDVLRSLTRDDRFPNGNKKVYTSSMIINTKPDQEQLNNPPDEMIERESWLAGRNDKGEFELIGDLPGLHRAHGNGLTERLSSYYGYRDLALIAVNSIDTPSSKLEFIIRDNQLVDKAA